MQNPLALLNLLADVTADRDRLAADVARMQKVGSELLAGTPEAAGATPKSDLVELLKAHVLRLRSELEAAKATEPKKRNKR